MVAESDSWVFDDPPDLGVFATRDVLAGAAPTIIEHDLDGDWSLSAGMPFEVDDTFLIHLGHLVEAHPSLREFATLPMGKGMRLEAGEWTTYDVEDEDEN